jgi:hypothetical protein
MFETSTVEVRCPKCRTGLDLQTGHAGWFTCPSCQWYGWIPVAPVGRLSAKIQSFTRNNSHLLLVLWLLLSSLAMTLYYFGTRSLSPIPWSGFCGAGFFITLLAVRNSRKVKASTPALARRLLIVFGIWAILALLFLTADSSLSLNVLGVDQFSIRVLLLLQPLARLVRKVPDLWVSAFIASALIVLLALPAILPERPATTLSPWSRAGRLLLRPLAALATRLGGTRAGQRLVSVLEPVGDTIAVSKAIAVGVLALGLSANVEITNFVLKNADALTAVSRNLLKAKVEWNGLTSEIITVSVLREAEAAWERTDGCQRTPRSNEAICESGPPTARAAVAATVHRRDPPYPGAPAEVGSTPPPGGGPGEPPRRPPQPGPPELETPPIEQAPDLGARLGTSRERLAGHVAYRVGDAWDKAAQITWSSLPKRPRFDELPRDATVADIQAARADFASEFPRTPSTTWITDLASASLVAADSGTAETLKSAVSAAVGAVTPLGDIVAEFVDLFLSGPAIEEARRRAQNYLKTRDVAPIEIIRDRFAGNAEPKLYRLRQLARYFVTGKATSDRNMMRNTLQKELLTIFDRVFSFQGLRASRDLADVRDHFARVAFPPGRDFSEDVVDSLMRYLSSAASGLPSQRFDRLITLKDFGVDTSRLAELREAKIDSSIDDALRSLSPTGSLSRRDLRGNWRADLGSRIVEDWLLGRASSPDSIVAVIAPEGGVGSNGYLATGIRCGQCVRLPERIPTGPRMCLKPGESPPCPDVNRQPFGRF